MTVSGAGLYVGHHIAFLQMQKASGAQLQYLPHKSGAPALKSVLGGQVMTGVNNLSDAYRSRDSLKIRAVADLERNAEFLPDVPTVKAQGYDIDDSSVNFRGIMAPKGTPQETLDLLAARMSEMFENDRVVKQMANRGSPLRVMSRDQVISM